MSWTRKKIKQKKSNSSSSNHKYNASKITVGGITFDSKLESYMYGRLKQFSVPFQFQFEVELQPAFRDINNKAVRRMYMVIDFVINKDGKMYFADTKGFATPDAKLKYKMLKYLVHKTGRNAEVLFCKNKGEVDSFINTLI